MVCGEPFQIKWGVLVNFFIIGCNNWKYETNTGTMTKISNITSHFIVLHSSISKIVWLENSKKLSGHISQHLMSWSWKWICTMLRLVWGVKTKIIITTPHLLPLYSPFTNNISISTISKRSTVHITLNEVVKLCIFIRTLSQ